MTIVEEPTESKILAIVYERRCIALEEISACLPDSTWNQVFASVDKLSRQGTVSLRRQGHDYELYARSPVGPTNGSPSALVLSARLQ